MDVDSRPPPLGFGEKGIKVRVITDEQLDAIAADADKFRESLMEEIELSKEATSARNRIFISALISIVAINSNVKSFKFVGVEIGFEDGISDLRTFTAVITIALAMHYLAAAFSERLSEEMMHEEREQGISTHITTLAGVRQELQDRFNN